jgi:hypothetical protein
MTKMKRLTAKEDILVNIPTPVSKEVIEERVKDYDLLTPKQFGTKYKDLLNWGMNSGYDTKSLRTAWCSSLRCLG